MPVYVCPQCGSRDLSPGRWFIGPVEHLNEPTDTMVCNRCDHRGIVLTFRDEKMAARYARSMRPEEAPPS